MDNYSNEEYSPKNSYHDNNNFRNDSQMEVTDGLFSRCSKKNEVKKEPGQKVTKKASRAGSSRACLSKPKRPINGYIMFYMELYAKNAGMHVTCVAKQAGKKWNCLSTKEKERYKQMAKARNEAEGTASNAAAAANRYPKLKIEKK